MISESGLVFLMGAGRFQTGEQIEVTSEYGSERHSDAMEASADGDVYFPVLFGEGDSGTATVYVKGGACDLSLEYDVGEDALVSQ